MISPISTSTVSNIAWDITEKKKKKKEKRGEKRREFAQRGNPAHSNLLYSTTQGGTEQNYKFPTGASVHSASQSPNFSPKWEISRSHPDDFIRTSMF